MAETILYQFAEAVLGQLGSAIVQEVKLVLGVADELDRIRSNLDSIRAVLQDAEKQQISSESVKNWLSKLQDVMYDIDDLLDGITTGVKMHNKNKGQFRKQVRKFFSRTNSLVLRWQWACQIKKLCNKLDMIALERTSLVLSNEHVDDLHSSVLALRETTANVNKSVLGRDGDKEVIVNSILSCRDCESLSVLPIVGFGGIGKTTLAQLIYNDSRIGDNFDEKLWVYVSEKFNIRKLLKQIISMAIGETILHKLSLEQLRRKTCEALKDKRYFLVLDDLWNEDSNEWLKLRELLDVGAKGSSVIVTTCNLKVASNVQSVKEYKLGVLSHELCLDIFKQLAFKEGEKIEPRLLVLADEIVKKSRGLPLLVTTLGNLLHGESDDKEWLSVIGKLEQGHEDILKILKLSYDQLPSHFKLCFRISSIYPKGDGIVPLLELLPLWMALGLLPFDHKGEALGVGRKCVKELLSKSLFVKEEEILSDDMFARFFMHGFVYDLAKSMVGEEMAIVNPNNKKVSEKVRYLRIDEDNLSKKLCHERVLDQAKKARLLMIKTHDQRFLRKAFLETIISKLSFLRVLDLSYCQFNQLPRTVGYMTHLRYLNLSGNVRLKKLPKSICKLINLQTLILLDCSNLQSLPTNIGRLENLKFLSLTVQLEILPEGVGHIKGLRFLVISECPRLALLPTSIKQLKKLDTLMIVDCKELDLTHESWSLEGLKSLRMLLIEGVPRFQKLPIGHPFISLQDLVLINCKGLVEIGGWIEYLTSLKMLCIRDCPSLEGLPCTLRPLNLKKLVINECPTLIRKCTPKKGENWPFISDIPHIELDEEIIIEGVISKVCRQWSRR